MLNWLPIGLKKTVYRLIDRTNDILMRLMRPLEAAFSNTAISVPAVASGQRSTAKN
jgi:hypothetical protein